MKSTTTAEHTFTNHFCKLWQEIPAYTNNKNDGNENDTMIESEALFGIDGTRKYFYATPRSIS
jgi:hypothetical protein